MTARTMVTAPMIIMRSDRPQPFSRWKRSRRDPGQEVDPEQLLEGGRHEGHERHRARRSRRPGSRCGRAWPRPCRWPRSSSGRRPGRPRPSGLTEIWDMVIVPDSDQRIPMPRIMAEVAQPADDEGLDRGPVGEPCRPIEIRSVQGDEQTLPRRRRGGRSCRPGPRRWPGPPTGRRRRNIRGPGGGPSSWPSSRGRSRTRNPARAEQDEAGEVEEPQVEVDAVAQPGEAAAPGS